MALQPIITNAGLKAAFDAAQAKISLTITHIGIDTSGYTPTIEQTALRREIVRLPISGGVMASDTQMHLTAVDDTGREYWVRGIGFYLSDGTLFAVYSHPTQPIAYKSAESVFVHAYDLLLTAVPAGSVSIEAAAPNLSLYFAEDFGHFSTAIFGQMLINLRQDEAIQQLQRTVQNQSEQINQLYQIMRDQQVRDDALSESIAVTGTSVLDNQIKRLN
ncbi:MAG: phage tail protein [Burkholderiaceae bacterium]